MVRAIALAALTSAIADHLVFPLDAPLLASARTLDRWSTARPRPSGSGDRIRGAIYNYPSGHVLEAMTILGMLVVRAWANVPATERSPRTSADPSVVAAGPRDEKAPA